MSTFVIKPDRAGIWKIESTGRELLKRLAADADNKERLPFQAASDADYAVYLEGKGVIVGGDGTAVLVGYKC